MNDNSIVGWLEANIPLHLGWCNNFVPTEGTRSEFLRAWITWGLSWGLVQVFRTGDNGQLPVGYVFARPITLKTALNPSIDYFSTLFYFESTGNTAWIDTLWAPGHYADVLAWLRGTRRKYVGWQHKGRYYLKEIADLSGDRPLKSQVQSGLIELFAGSRNPTS